MLETKVLNFLQEEIDAQHIPGAVIHVSYKNEVVVHQAIGNRKIFPEPAKMEINTIFDLASLTKVVATLPAVLRLMEDGKIRLDDAVTSYFPNFERHGKENIRIYHLLTHTSGLPAHKPFFAESLTREQIIDRICDEKLVSQLEEKVTYSDLGLIILYFIVEQITGQPFDRFVKQQLFDPLEMTETTFNPTFDETRYAATEFSSKRNAYKLGIVHDENAESMGGVSGHAGLFSTAADLAKFTSMVEHDGQYKGKRILSKAALDLSRQKFTGFDREHRGLGWILKSPRYSSCGDFFSPSSYGHTGFTGTSIWFDPSVQLHVILLTNRVHFGRQDHIIRMRPRLHNIIRSHFND